jgi:hypothetical protein
MGDFYRVLIHTTLWLGIATFVLALFLMIFSLGFPFQLTPGGIVHGAQTFLLVAVAAYCAHKVTSPP